MFCRVLRARPVEDAALVSRFAQMAQTCGLREVKLAQVDLRGGSFANAVALPTIRQSAVVVSSTLVERLDHDEAAAILAHELPHRALHVASSPPGASGQLRDGRGGRAACARSASRVPAGVHRDPDRMAAGPARCAGASSAQPAEARDREQSARSRSHGRSRCAGARLDQASRAGPRPAPVGHGVRAAGQPSESRAAHSGYTDRRRDGPATLAQAAVFASADGDSSVTFHEDRLVWIENASAKVTQSGAGQLTMLRVDAKTSGTPRLVAVDWRAAAGDRASTSRRRTRSDNARHRRHAAGRDGGTSSFVVQRGPCLAGVVAGACVIVDSSPCCWSPCWLPSNRRRR